MKTLGIYPLLGLALLSSSIAFASPKFAGLLGIESLNNPGKLLGLEELPAEVLVARAEKIRERDEVDYDISLEEQSIQQSDFSRSNLEYSGMLGIENIVFTQTAATPQQDYTNNVSMVVEPEFVYEWDDGDQLIAFKPFLRLDQHDNQRSHFDIRELIYEKASQDWELRLGVGKVFWGVTEFQHLVDIINQTDLVENIDTEDKLGQPMINFAWIQDWGTMDFFILPYFRERTFPGIEGRLRTQPRVDVDNPLYESSREEKHIDTAIRYSHYFGDWDIGLSHFYGTSREPRFIAAIDSSGNPVLRPFYDIINQTSLDLQATKGNWLWKLEALHRRGQGSPFTTLGGGFEYTFVGAFESTIDIGVIGEYYYDSRGENNLNIFEDDIALGTRVAFNDAQSSELLAGLVWDRNTGGKFFNIEANRRLSNNFFLELESRFFVNQDRTDPAFFVSKDDHLKIFLTYNY